METKYKVIGVTVSLVTAFAFGRYTVPEHIKIETKVVEVERKKESIDKDVNQNKRKETTITETVKPDGTKEVTTKIIEDTVKEDKSKVAKVEADTKKEDTVKDIKKESGRVDISALAGYDFNKGQMTYGASVSRPILGPITLGAWGLVNGTVGMSAGLQF